VPKEVPYVIGVVIDRALMSHAHGKVNKKPRPPCMFLVKILPVFTFLGYEKCYLVMVLLKATLLCCFYDTKKNIWLTVMALTTPLELIYHHSLENSFYHFSFLISCFENNIKIQIYSDCFSLYITTHHQTHFTIFPF
jgi:hypothetical protein